MHPNSIWRSNRYMNSDDPEQGWKVHISSTIINASQVLKCVAPFLSKLEVLYKAPISLYELGKINSGLYYGFSQIGKFITVYPRSNEEALYITEMLHNMTTNLNAPIIPFDLRFKENSCVYYRYGAFKLINMNYRGTVTPAVRDLFGNLVPDLRSSGSAAPSWLNNPFSNISHANTTQSSGEDMPLGKTIFAYEAITQRGKGGVYSSIDLSVKPTRRCILKEGRSNGETNWDSSDGYSRLKHEEMIIKCLNENGIDVPKIFSSFIYQNNYYVVMEYIEGENLNSLINKGISFKNALNYGLQLTSIIDKIHSCGWVWRDCKPMNLIIDYNDLLRPLDFEGACNIDNPDETPWGSPGFAPPEWREYPLNKSRLPEDLYALGVTLHQIFSKCLQQEDISVQLTTPILEMIITLLHLDPNKRPQAKQVYEILAKVYRNI
ncbi:protein kinase domain-containing protein [Paenibacillus sp. FSL R7-0331]|uniref:class III lanthionine synthetase LanKC N-terminal domain-containing protein n=1 Tax=Paenibacillus sp. FSL R7-0331 TaxID=1536773 RepID=UPI003FA601F8